MIWADLMHIRGTSFFHHWLIMGRSRNWHDLRSPIYKIRNIQIVDTHALTVHCEFQRVRITGVSLARCQTSKNATWGQVTYCDLVTWPLGSSGRRFFRNVSNCWLNSYGKFGGATRRRFFAICEKPEGGVEINPPPPVRGLKDLGPYTIQYRISCWALC